MEEHVQATEAILQNRCLLLLLFRRAFVQEPDEELLSLLAADEAAEAVELFAADGTGLASLAKTLRALQSKRGNAEFIDAVRAEYTRMFIGPQKIVAPFWESVYLDPRELLFLESTADVRKRYEAEGYRVDTGVHEAEDSLALQLDFIGQLAQRTLQALCAGDRDEYARLLDAQLAFERDHMLTWLPQFAQRAQNAPTAHLYPALCAGIDRLVALDAAMLEELAAEARCSAR